jgi:hypothetical protein
MDANIFPNKSIPRSLDSTAWPYDMPLHRRSGDATIRLYFPGINAHRQWYGGVVRGIRNLKFLLVVALGGILLATAGHAASPMAAQVCNLLSSPSLLAVQSSKGTGEGCAWQWPNGQVLSVYVHVDQQSETVAGTHQMMDSYLQNSAFKKTAFPVCTGGDMVVGDFRNGKGPGGTGYTQCSGFVLTFSFQGNDARKHLPGVAKQLAGTNFHH